GESAQRADEVNHEPTRGLRILQHLRAGDEPSIRRIENRLVAGAREQRIRIPAEDETDLEIEESAVEGVVVGVRGAKYPRLPKCSKVLLRAVERSTEQIDVILR